MTDRPRPEEYAPFYAGYIDAVPDVDLFETLETQPVELDQLLAEADPDYAYEPGKWTVLQVIQHMADTERVFAFRALWWARGETSPLAGFDQDEWMPHAPEQSLGEAFTEFLAIRASALALLQPLAPEAWGRGGEASGHHMTVRAAAWVLAGHVEHHTRILRERYGLG